MDFNIEIRRNQLQNLDQFISSSKDKVQSILECLGWDEEKLFNDEKLVPCSINPSHRLPERSMQNHLEKCVLRSQGYELDEVFLSEPSNTPGVSIKLDSKIVDDILSSSKQSTPDSKPVGLNGREAIARTSDRIFSTYSREERLQLHDYVINNTKGPPPLPEFNVSQPRHQLSKELSVEELKLAERDARRRRTKYKSVHTNRKNHTEVIREVIESQMDQYRDWLEINDKSKKSNEKCDSKKNCVEKNGSATKKLDKTAESKSSNGLSTSDWRRHKDSSRSRKHSRERHRSSRSRSKEHHRKRRRSYSKH